MKSHLKAVSIIKLEGEFLMTETINSGVAMLQTMESWGIDHLYGLPGGTVNNIMYALDAEKDRIKFIHVRHEEVGAMAASADYKIGGQIGVAIGSAGPGATHLMQGIYDAKMDKVPALFLVGQSPQADMNMDAFQELDEDPMFQDGAVYARTVTTAESLPHVIDEAIRRAYAYHGPAVIIIPNDLAGKEIPADGYYSAANAHRFNQLQAPEDDQIIAALDLIKQAQHPVIFAGIGIQDHADQAMELAQKLQMPIVHSAIARDIIPTDFEANLGSSMRVATKPANEAMAQTDLILMLGSNMPFSHKEFPKNAKVIQIDTNSANLGKRHHVDVAILSDAGEALAKLLKLSEPQPDSDWYQANVANNKNWWQYLDSLMNRTTNPMRVEPAFKQINRIAQPDAIFSVDVGQVDQNSVRMLHMNGQKRWFTSGLFATMGFGLPGAIAASLQYPGRQVFNLAGDGALSMVMQDLDTEKRYHLPIINVVFSNDVLGFIQDEQEDENHEFFGISLDSMDFAKIAEAQGVTGIDVTDVKDLVAAFDKANEIAAMGEPVLINVHAVDQRPIPVEHLQLDPAQFSNEQIQAFKQRYLAEDLQPLSYFLNQSK